MCLLVKVKELIDFIFSFNLFHSFWSSFLSVICNLIQVIHIQGCGLDFNEVGANRGDLSWITQVVLYSHMPKPYTLVGIGLYLFIDPNKW